MATAVLLLSCVQTRHPLPSPTETVVVTAGNEPAQIAAPAPESQLKRLDQDDAWHLLSRATFGPSPQDQTALKELGFTAWLEAQLTPPEREENERLREALKPYAGSVLPPLALIGRYQQGGAEGPVKRGDVQKKRNTVNYGKLLSDTQMALLTRQLLSEFQLREVMVDFWLNHFNVFARKGDVKLVTSDWIREAIRPHALGRFEDLLVATARHPAMLIYLDNVASVKEQTTKRGKRGLNENYARELLELHTLGVDGGYDQNDIKEAARVFTGWSVDGLPKGNITYLFRKNSHDPKPKVVLNRLYKWEEKKDDTEGLSLLHDLAQHPETALHLSRKFCQRFVDDHPPKDCVRSTAEAFEASDGNIADTLRSLFLHPSFWSPNFRGSKFKTPLEFVLSASRAFDAESTGGAELVGHLAQLGQEPLMQRIPTGYPETADAWNSSASMLSRFQFAALFSAQWESGVAFDWSFERSEVNSAKKLVGALNALLLGGRGKQQSLEAITQEADAVASRVQRRRLALSLFLSSPEFQRQ